MVSLDFNCKELHISIVRHRGSERTVRGLGRSFPGRESVSRSLSCSCQRFSASEILVCILGIHVSGLGQGTYFGSSQSQNSPEIGILVRNDNPVQKPAGLRGVRGEILLAPPRVLKWPITSRWRITTTTARVTFNYTLMVWTRTV